MYRTVALSMLLVGFLVNISPAKPRSTSTIHRIYADKNRDVHIVLNNGKETLVPHQQDQTGIDDAKIAPDRRTAGWLGLYPVPDNTSGQFDGSLVIWRDGKIVGSLTQGQRTGAGPLFTEAIKSPTIAGHYMKARPRIANCAT
jgi:hypothetical protein